MAYVILFLLLLLAYSAVSRALDRTVLTAPILFTGVGMLAGYLELPGHGLSGGKEVFLGVAEIGLALTLFVDASRTNLRVLRRIRDLPTRLLTTGMLLTIAVGMGLALLTIPGISVWEAGALAAILAPTDAGLGLVIVNSPKVPEKIRQALNVEAGLNDGLSVPFLLFFIVMAGATGEGDVSGLLVTYLWEQLGIGTLLGAACGLAGGLALGLAHRRETVSHAFAGIGVVTIPFLCIVAAEPLAASMFIAAFVAGLVAQLGFRDIGRHSVQLAEEWGQFLNLAVFFLFGMIVQGLLPHVTAPMVAYALLSLTVVRMLPVWLALRGTGEATATALFMGWFGPRGLASIVLGLIFLEGESHTPGTGAIVLTVATTVLFSVVLHGVSARPGINALARRLPPEPKATA